MSYTTNDRVRAALLAYHSGDMDWDSQDEELMRLALAAAYPSLTEEVDRLRDENERLRGDDLAQRIIGTLEDYRGLRPEDGETWESWYYAAFDMAKEKISILLSRAKTAGEVA